jgi:hypothetical protein
MLKPWLALDVLVHSTNRTGAEAKKAWPTLASNSGLAPYHDFTKALRRIDSTSGYKRRSLVSSKLLSPGDAVGSSCITSIDTRAGSGRGFSLRAVARPTGIKGEPVNETFVIEEIKLKAIGSPAEVLSRCPAPKATMPHLRKLIRRRMSFHYGQKEVQTVRLVDVNNEEVYHWTWFQEQVRRENIGRRQSGRRA